MISKIRFSSVYTWTCQHRRNFSKVGITALVAFSLGGCAAINPHVRIEAPNTDMSLTSGYRFADEAIKQYRQAIRDQASLRAATGLTLIPISAGALRYGILGDHTRAITNLGTAGAAIYGTSSWFSNNSRSGIYAAGIKGMSCVKDAMAPYLSVENEKEDLKAGINAIIPAITKTYEGISTVEVQINVLRELPTPSMRIQGAIASAETEVNSAKASINSAKSTHEAGKKLMSVLNQAGPAMHSAVDRVAAEVDVFLSGTLPDLTALSSVISGLAKIGDNIVGAPISAAVINQGEQSNKKNQLQATMNEAQEKENTLLNPLKNALKTLIKNEIALETEKTKVASIVNNFDPTPPVSVLKSSCNLEQNDLVKELSVTPVDPVLTTHGVSIQTYRTVKGGSGQYLIQALYPGDNVPQVSQAQSFGAVFTVNVLDTTEPGKYPVLIQDTAGKSMVLNIQVKKNVTPIPVKTKVPVPTQSNKEQKTAFENLLSEEEIKLLQGALNSLNIPSIKVDGKLGKETWSAIETLTGRENDLEKGRHLDEKLVQQILGKGLDLTIPITQIEKDLEPEDLVEVIEKLRAKVSLSADINNFSTELRKAIRDYQGLYGDIANTGLLSAKTLGHLSNSQ